jgi:hypothetical protein
MSQTCNPFHDNPNCQLQANTSLYFVAKDKRATSEYRIQNPQHKFVVKLQVDGCLISSNNQRKCDFLFLACEQEKEGIAYFVELKGSNLSDAIDQIKSTIELLYPKLSDFSFRCRIIQTRTPPTQVISQKKEVLLNFLKNHKFAANVRSIKVTEIIKIQSKSYTETI